MTWYKSDPDPTAIYPCWSEYDNNGTKPGNKITN